MTCNKHCDGCDYLSGTSNAGTRTCDYILITGRRRGCPAGSGCTRRSVGGVVSLRGIAADINQSVKLAEKKERNPISGSRSDSAKQSWASRYADPAYQIEQIRKWDAMGDDQLRKAISHKREWRRKREAAHGEKT